MLVIKSQQDPVEQIENLETDLNQHGNGSRDICDSDNTSDLRRKVGYLGNSAGIIRYQRENGQFCIIYQKYIIG